MEQKRRALRIYSNEDLELHRKAGDCWIVRNGRVYDVTNFVNDHPGGEELVLQFSGKDIGSAMENEEDHVHSASAYSVLEEYLVGKLGNDALIVTEGILSMYNGS